MHTSNPHQFINDYDDIRCVNCDCRPAGRWDRGLSCRCIDEISTFSPLVQRVIESDLDMFADGYNLRREATAPDSDYLQSLSTIELFVLTCGAIAYDRLSNSDDIMPLALDDIVASLDA